jgi:hypothetical protein
MTDTITSQNTDFSSESPCVYIYIHPITGHEGPEVEQRYCSTLSLTSELYGVGGKRHAPAALYIDTHTHTHTHTHVYIYIYISYVPHACIKLSVYLTLLHMTNSQKCSE